MSKYKALLDSNNYFTGMYCIIGDIGIGQNQTKIECDSIPVDDDWLKLQSYKWDSTTSTWTYDSDRYTTLESAKITPVTSYSASEITAKLDYIMMMGGY